MSVVAIRQWCDADLEPCAALNADLEVMRYFPSPLTREESDALVERQRSLIDSRGWGLWAVEIDGAFAGFTGLAVPSFEASFMPCVEIGWRIARRFWGQSIAYRAAVLALSYGFDTLKLVEIVSFTAAVNSRSTRLMERLGFARDQHGDFFHPRIDRSHELSRHVLYRKRPNQSPEPTPTSVTPRACARVAPAAVVAHL
jgi:RimJ/RimL family protein N-acetyltransferase